MELVFRPRDKSQRISKGKIFHLRICLAQIKCKKIYYKITELLPA